MCISRSDSEQRLYLKQQREQQQQQQKVAMGAMGSLGNVQATPLQAQGCKASQAELQQSEQEALFGQQDTAPGGDSRLRMREFGLIYFAYMGFLMVRQRPLAHRRPYARARALAPFWAPTSTGPL